MFANKFAKGVFIGLYVLKFFVDGYDGHRGEEK